MARKTSQNKLAPSKQKGLPQMASDKEPTSQPENSSGDVGRDRRSSPLIYECLNCATGLLEAYCHVCATDKWIIEIEPDGAGEPPY